MSGPADIAKTSFVLFGFVALAYAVTVLPHGPKPVDPHADVVLKKEGYTKAIFKESALGLCGLHAYRTGFIAERSGRKYSGVLCSGGRMNKVIILPFCPR